MLFFFERNRTILGQENAVHIIQLQHNTRNNVLSCEKKTVFWVDQCFSLSLTVFSPLLRNSYLHKNRRLHDRFKVLTLTSESIRLVGWSVFEGPQLWNGNETLIGLHRALSCLWLTRVTYGGSLPNSSSRPSLSISLSFPPSFSQPLQQPAPPRGPSPRQGTGRSLGVPTGARPPGP